MAPATAFPEVVAEAVGAACAVLAAREEAIAEEALALTAREDWATLEWVYERGARTCDGVWPRSIACRLERHRTGDGPALRPHTWP